MFLDRSEKIPPYFPLTEIAERNCEFVIKAVRPFEKWPLENRSSRPGKPITPNLDDKFRKLAISLPFLLGVFDSRVHHPLRILREGVLNCKLEKVDGFPYPILSKYRYGLFFKYIKVNAHISPKISLIVLKI